MENETSRSEDAFLASETQKSGAIKRHYDRVTDPAVDSGEHNQSLRALAVLSRDTGRQIIISLLDKLIRREDKINSKNPVIEKK